MRNPLPNFSASQVPDLEDSTAKDFLEKHVVQVGQHVTDVQRTLSKMPDMRSIGHICEFRLTGSTGVPVTTSDVAGITTLYCSPYKGNRIALYDGKTWPVYESDEFSIAVPNTSSQMYDVFCYANKNIPTLELLAWTNDTTRATALTTQNGVLVKTGDVSRRYLGSFRTTSVSGQTEDSLAKRYIWNYYNRLRRPMVVTESTASWNYTTATIRQANGSTANQLAFVIGWAEEPVTARVRAMLSNTSAGVTAYVGIALDATNGTTGGALQRWSVQTTMVAGTAQLSSVDYELMISVGRHFLAWVEFSAASGTTTFYSGGFSGIQGEIWG